MNQSNRNSPRFRIAKPTGKALSQYSIHVFLGKNNLSVINVSETGLALLLEHECEWTRGDILDAAVQLRGRNFALKLEVMNVQSLRVGCQFLDAPDNFLPALRDFLKPKNAASRLVFKEEWANLPEVLEQLPGTENFECYLSTEDRCGFFVWMGSSRELLRLVAMSGEMLCEYKKGSPTRAGRLPSQDSTSEWNLQNLDAEGISWQRTIEDAQIFYFSDLMTAWLPQGDGARLAEAIFSVDSENAQIDESDEKKLRFPKV